MKRSIFLAAVLLCLLMGSCGWNDTSKEELGQDQAEERCREIQAQYQDLYETGERTQPEDTWDSSVLTQSVIDAIEDRLGQEGLGIVDSHERYPGYLTTADSFRTFLEDVAQHRVDIVGLEKSIPKKVHMASASLSKFVMHSPSAIYVQTNQAVMSADRGARKAAETVREKTSDLIGTAAEIEARIRELGKR